MSAQPPLHEARAQRDGPLRSVRGGVEGREPYQLLQSEIERVRTVLAPYCSGLTLRVEWTSVPGTPEPAGRTAGGPLPLGGAMHRVGDGAAAELPCAECLRQSLTSSLEAAAARCCACVRGYWRSWLPLGIANELWGVLSLCSEGEQAAEGAGCSAPEMRVSDQGFRNAVSLASALVAGGVARVEKALLERAQAPPTGTVPLARAGQRVARDSGGTGDKAVAADGHAGVPASTLSSRIVALIQEDGSCSVTLKELGHRFSRNPAYLSDLFAREVGVPFKRFLTEFRLNQARRLLLDSTRSITEIARFVGYASEERFRAAFKQATGCSPLDWRTRGRAGLGAASRY